MNKTQTIGSLALVALTAISPSAREAGAQNEKALSYLMIAHQCEMGARCKYLLYAEIARQEGHPDIATCFLAIARAEQIHQWRLERMIGERGGTPGHHVPPFEVGSTEDNLRSSSVNEMEEYKSIYPHIRDGLHRAGDYPGCQELSYAESAEHSHDVVFRNALASLTHPNPGPHALPIYVCGECGCAHLFERPEKCAGCGCTSGNFLAYN